MKHYSYKGYNYQPWKTHENGHIIHEVTNPCGNISYLSWSPYSTPDDLEFALWVDMGQPTIPNIKLDSQELEAYYYTYKDRILDI